MKREQVSLEVIEQTRIIPRVPVVLLTRRSDIRAHFEGVRWREFEMLTIAWNGRQLKCFSVRMET